MQDLEANLVSERWVTLRQLNSAKEEALKSGRSVWSILVKLSYISEEKLFVFFSQEAGIPYIEISDYKIKPEALSLIDEDFCRANSVIPLFKVGGLLFIACCNPLDAALTDNVAKLSGYNVESVLAPQASIIKALDYYYGPEDRIFNLEKLIVKRPQLSGISFIRESERLDLEMPVGIGIREGQPVALNYSSPIEGYTRNISRSGNALGLEAKLFLPKGLELFLEFKPGDALLARDEIITARGEVIYCRMEENRQHYFLGIRFIEIKEDALKKLFKLAREKNA